MSNIKQFAISELTRIGMYNSDDEMNQDMCKHILKMVDTFSEEGHSGFSASYAIGILEKLLRWEPLSPLTGEDDEWMEVGFGIYQNIRCSHVFKKGKNGRAYDLDGRVFIDQNGCSYGSRDSIVFINFPYTPKTEYIRDSDFLRMLYIKVQRWMRRYKFLKFS